MPFTAQPCVSPENRRLSIGSSLAPASPPSTTVHASPPSVVFRSVPLAPETQPTCSLTKCTSVSLMSCLKFTGSQMALNFGFSAALSVFFGVCAEDEGATTNMTPVSRRHRNRSSE